MLHDILSFIVGKFRLEVSQLSILAGQALSKEPETQNLTFEERYKEPIGLISFFYRAIPPPVFGETLQYQLRHASLFFLTSITDFQAISRKTNESFFVLPENQKNLLPRF